MKLHEVPRLYRRAIIIYIAAIVVPACLLVWLGLQSFERQRQALATLSAEKLATELAVRMRSVAEVALSDHKHSIAKYFFTIENGVVTRPALQAPPPRPVRAEFLAAERLELDLNRPDLALESYRKLLAANPSASLALSRIARCLAKIGRIDESRATWRRLAASYPDDQDSSHRPYGIVAAMEAGDTAGLYEQIESGRWDLAGDQAEYFLSRLDSKRTSRYLNQFRFARELSEQFRPPLTSHINEISKDVFGTYTLFYRNDGAGHISGLAIDDDWVNRSLKPQLAREFNLGGRSGQDLWAYGGAIAFVLIISSAGIVLLLRDISREARTNQLRTDFVSSVSHELKTPITLIRLYSETLLRLSGFRNEAGADFCNIIMRESDRLGRLVDQILMFSRVEKGDRIYNFEEADPAPVIARTVDDYREYLERAGFVVQRLLPVSVPAVRFDAEALSQAVVNLLDNAVKYSAQSREIAVRLGVQDATVRFEVEDHGMGIPASEQQKIFDRFYRISNDSGKGGYGLGLFLVRHIMEAHGGQAEVDSEPGRGSRFRLIFPLATQ